MHLFFAEISDHLISLRPIYGCLVNGCAATWNHRQPLSKTACHLSQKHVSLSHSLLRGSIYQSCVCPPSLPGTAAKAGPQLREKGICNLKGLIKEREQGVLPPVKSVETRLLSFNYEDNKTRQHLFREYNKHRTGKVPWDVCAPQTSPLEDFLH